MNIRTYRISATGVDTPISSIIGEEYPKIREIHFFLSANCLIVFKSLKQQGFNFTDGDTINIQNTTDAGATLFYKLPVNLPPWNDYLDVRNQLQINVSGASAYMIVFFD